MRDGRVEAGEQFNSIHLLWGGGSCHRTCATDGGKSVPGASSGRGQHNIAQALLFGLDQNGGDWGAKALTPRIPHTRRCGAGGRIRTGRLPSLGVSIALWEWLQTDKTSTYQMVSRRASASRFARSMVRHWPPDSSKKPGGFCGRGMAVFCSKITTRSVFLL